jgi:adenylate kinase family enzyme
MPNYDFSTLNDKDLENLVGDLLREDLKIQFQSFKAGSDSGIDLRYSTNSSENKIIVQVKHYLKSGFKKLLYELERKEKPKVEKLQPKRYILATSVPLSPANKERIRDSMKPFITNSNDVYGCDDLNNLLLKHDEVEKRHFKLWLSSTKVIRTILNNAIYERSAFSEEQIQKNAQLYVFTKSFNRAMEILKQHKILLITGIPGVGKTTLASMVAYKLLSEDFQLVYIDEKIREAEDVFNPKEKQLFFFDDFLGSNYFEIMNPKNTDKILVKFIERIKHSEHKYFILTTRTTILNQARSMHEKLARENLDPLKCEIELKDYSDLDKARILYNHLYFNDLREDLIRELQKDRNYWKIIKHKNYNPRFIEYFTNTSYVGHLKAEEYLDFTISKLDKPSDIWAHAIENQLNPEEQFLLYSLLSLGNRVLRTDLEQAFDSRINCEVNSHGFTRKVNIFYRAFRNLSDGYIENISLGLASDKSLVDFINPSLRDYLIQYFNENKSEKWRLIDSFCFIEQFMSLFGPQKKETEAIIIEDEEIEKFLQFASKRELLSTRKNDEDNMKLKMASLFFKYIARDNGNFIETNIVQILEGVSWSSIEMESSYSMVNIMENADEEGILYRFMKKEFHHIIKAILRDTVDDYEMDMIKGLFEKYKYYYEEYIEEHQDILADIEEVLERVFISEATSIIDEEKSRIFDENDFAEMERNVEVRLGEIQDKYLNGRTIKIYDNPIHDINIEEIMEDNRIASYNEDNDFEDWKDLSFERRSDEIIIDDMFSKIEK